jgi:hypothetical protein
MKILKKIKTILKSIEFKDIVAMIGVIIVVLIIASVLIYNTNRLPELNPGGQSQTADEALQNLLLRKRTENITIEDFEKINQDYGESVTPPGYIMRQFNQELGIPSAGELFGDIDELGRSEADIQQP